jgi:hypothetical protein
MPSDNKELSKKVEAIVYDLVHNDYLVEYTDGGTDTTKGEQAILALIADQCQEAYKRGYIDAGVEALREEA